MKVTKRQLKQLIKEEFETSVDEGIMDMLGLSQKSSDMKHVAAQLSIWQKGYANDLVRDAIKTLKSHDDGTDPKLRKMVSSLNDILKNHPDGASTAAQAAASSPQRSQQRSSDDPDHPDNIRARRRSRQSQADSDKYWSRTTDDIYGKRHSSRNKELNRYQHYREDIERIIEEELAKVLQGK